MIRIKRGDTFSFNFELKDDDGEPLDLEVSDIKCQMKTRTGRALIEEFIITKTDTLGLYNFEGGDTSVYPLGIHDADIKFIVDGITTSTATFNIEVVEEITI
jgi:hypothetical protein